MGGPSQGTAVFSPRPESSGHGREAFASRVAERAS